MKDNLNKVEMLNRVEKMLIAADDLKVGSDILSGRLVTSMIGQGLLDVLELEILLKATLLAEQGQPKNFAHNYRKIWRAVTDQTKSFVVAEASQRYSGHANLEDVFSILADLEDVFVNDRYSYELSGDWELRFHPIERLGLCFGLRNWLKNWILKEKSIVNWCLVSRSEPAREKESNETQDEPSPHPGGLLGGIAALPGLSA